MGLLPLRLRPVRPSFIDMTSVEARRADPAALKPIGQIQGCRVSPLGADRGGKTYSAQTNQALRRMPALRQCHGDESEIAAHVVETV